MTTRTGSAPANAPHGQLRVVGDHRADADHDCINRGAEGVEVVERVGTVDPAAVTGNRCNPAVQ